MKRSPIDLTNSVVVITGAAGGIGSAVAAALHQRGARVVLVDLDRPHLTPLYDVVSHLVYAVRASDVSTVLVNGRVVVRGRHLLRVDEQELASHATRLATGMIARARARTGVDYLAPQSPTHS